jgi:RimJ/RimL family protein N-acetyltransferase
MLDPTLTLHGQHIRLEPLAHHHAEALAALTTPDPALYQWSAVPHTLPATIRYIETALAGRAAGTTQAFAVIRLADNTAIGSTRFFDIENWPWPESHPRHNHPHPDVAEIGYTWYAPSAVRTPVNTEAKTLLLTHAFETWNILRICLHTDARNARSRAAMERIGARFEGILRSHRLAADNTPRNSARYSITTAEWPQVKQTLQHLATKYT